MSIRPPLVRRSGEGSEVCSLPITRTGDEPMTHRARKATNGAAWTAQTLLALLFVFAGTMKFIMPPEKMQGPIALPLGFIYFIGAMEILGGLGLVLPGLYRIRPELTTIAAVGLLTIMSGATT